MTGARKGHRYARHPLGCSAGRRCERCANALLLPPARAPFALLSVRRENFPTDEILDGTVFKTKCKFFCHVMDFMHG